MTTQHSKRVEVSTFATYREAVRFRDELIEERAWEGPLQIRKHPGYFAVVQRVPIKKEVKTA